MRSTKRAGLCLGLIGVMLALDVSSAFAQSVIEEVIVTARRREESLQEVPVAISAIPQEKLSNGAPFEIISLAYRVPGLQASNTIGERNDVVFSIRGQSVSFGSLFPAVIPYFAEVPLLKVTTGTFYDLDDVQVLRGPQGTLFGRVTDGGNVLINPAKPTDEFEGYISAKFGNYELNQFTGAVNVPIYEDKVLARVAFDVADRKGFTRHAPTGRDLDNINYDSFRVSLVLRPSDRLENYTIWAFNRADENGSGVQIEGVNPVGVLHSTAGLLGEAGAAAKLAGLQAALAQDIADGPRISSAGSALYGANYGLFAKRRDTYLVNKTTFQLNDQITLRNILGYIRFKQHTGTDYDGSSEPYIDTPHIFLPQFDFYREHKSEEFQILANLLDDNLDLTLGVYLDKQKTPGKAENYVTSFGIIERNLIQFADTDSEAYYGQIHYELGHMSEGLDAWSLDAGIRYTKDKVDSHNATYLAIPLGDPVGSTVPHGVCLPASEFPPTTFPPPLSQACTLFKGDFTATTWTVGLDYQINDLAIAYVKVSKGYRPGGVNTTANPGVDPAYDEEYDKSVEIGTKIDYQFGDVSTRTNLAVFRDKYTDIQKLISTISPVTGQPTSLIVNTDVPAIIKGIELEETVVFGGLSVGLSYGYLDAKYRNTLSPEEFTLACPPGDPHTSTVEPIGFCPLNDVSGTPKHSVTFDVHYAVDLPSDLGTLTFGGDVYHRSSMANVENDESHLRPEGSIVPKLTLYNLDATWSNVAGQPIDLSFFVQNLTDKKFVQSRNTLENGATVGVRHVLYGPPRFIGGSFTYHFGSI